MSIVIIIIIIIMAAKWKIINRNRNRNREKKSKMTNGTKYLFFKEVSGAKENSGSGNGPDVSKHS